jgi:hypothetical protein
MQKTEVNGEAEWRIQLLCQFHDRGVMSLKNTQTESCDVLCLGAFVGRVRVGF